MIPSLKIITSLVGGALIIASLGVGCRSPGHQESDTVVRIYTTLTYALVKGRSRVSYTCNQEGAGFLLKDRILTAKHVLMGPEPRGITRLGKYVIGERKYKIESLNIHIRVSARTFRPTALQVSHDLDLAAIFLDGGDIKRVRLRNLSRTRKPKPDDRVYVWGFPGTTTPQVDDRPIVTSVYPKYFVLNKPLEPGYSGGPVLGTDDRLLGLVIRSEEFQTRVLLLSPAAFDGVIIKYQDQMRFPPRTP